MDTYATLRETTRARLDAAAGEADATVAVLDHFCQHAPSAPQPDRSVCGDCGAVVGARCLPEGQWHPQRYALRDILYEAQLPYLPDGTYGDFNMFADVEHGRVVLGVASARAPRATLLTMLVDLNRNRQAPSTCRATAVPTSDAQTTAGIPVDLDTVAGARLIAAWVLARDVAQARVWVAAVLEAQGCRKWALPSWVAQPSLNKEPLDRLVTSYGRRLLPGTPYVEGHVGQWPENAYRAALVDGDLSGLWPYLTGTE